MVRCLGRCQPSSASRCASGSVAAAPARAPPSLLLLAAANQMPPCIVPRLDSGQLGNVKLRRQLYRRRREAEAAEEAMREAAEAAGDAAADDAADDAAADAAAGGVVTASLLPQVAAPVRLCGRGELEW